MNYTYIKRLYLDNYKLFSNQNITFNDNLNIFDGPNGYGKTSLFDAIEYLITNEISRIIESECILGSTKYYGHFLAKNPKKDVLVKAEFIIKDESGENKIVLAKKIPPLSEKQKNGSLDFNPKKLLSNTINYILPNFEIANEDWDKYETSSEEICKQQIIMFGENTKSLYKLLYYVQQEDRLSYFKNTEKDRISCLDSLFNTDRYQQKLDEIKGNRKKLTDLIKYLTKNIEKLSDELVGYKSTDAQTPAQYSQMFKRAISWDLPSPVVGTQNEFAQIIEQLNNIHQLCKFKQEFLQDYYNQQCDKILNLTSDEQQQELCRYMFYKQIEFDTKSLSEVKKKHSFLLTQYNYVQNKEWLKINYKELQQYIKDDEGILHIVTNINKYNELQNQATNIQKTVTSLLDLRNKLKSKYDESYSEFSTCPYCGFDWSSIEKLEEQFNNTTDNMKILSGSIAGECDSLINQIEEIFTNKYLLEIESSLKKYQSNILLQYYIKYDQQSDIEKAVNIKNIIESLSIEENNKISADNDATLKSVHSILKLIEAKKSQVSEQYISAKNQNMFNNIFKLFFESLDELKSLEMDAVDNKIIYLHYIYNTNMIVKKTQHDDYQKKLQFLESTLKKRIDDYEKCLKDAINTYKAQIISSIEIPFFLYSSRILQSYQGGQGVLIDNSIIGSMRFVAPGREHDVLYTMSSGQLSAVLLSFSLSLNKVFAGNGLKTLLIDDPVQCMDDINMLSFVEVLRNEFSDVQVIVSTHETNFANYVKYKYKKYNLECQTIRLKAINTEKL